MSLFNKKEVIEAPKKEWTYEHRLCEHCFKKFGEGHVSKVCNKCGEFDEETKCQYMGSHRLCKKCYSISLDGGFFTGTSKLSEEWRFIWYDAVDIKGVDWYKKARDVLLLKMKKQGEAYERKEQRRKVNVAKRIEDGMK